MGRGGRQNLPFMGVEIERKFLLSGDGWRQLAVSSQQLRQGYLAVDGATNVRVRTDGRRAWITLKGRGEGMVRPEFEYEIPAADAGELLALCRGRIVEKMRYRVPTGRHLWEIDEFAGANLGLVVAEIELRGESESFERPDWIGSEVTSDPRYLNANLAVHPFADWSC